MRRLGGPLLPVPVQGPRARPKYRVKVVQFGSAFGPESSLFKPNVASGFPAGGGAAEIVSVCDAHGEVRDPV
jgi:hypothetical protein